MVPGEVSTTETGGSIFSSTFDAVETCPNEWVDDDWECLKFTITTESGVSTYPFVGPGGLQILGPSRFIAENGPFQRLRMDPLKSSGVVENSASKPCALGLLR